MYKKLSIFICTCVLAMGGLTGSNVMADSPIQIQRIWGSDRYITCSYIAETGWESSNYAVIVNGENFPDALSAASLAKKFNAPILLTQSNMLSQNALIELERLKVKNVFIVGGESAISEGIEEYIRNLGITTTRYSGIDRNETSVKVAEQIGNNNGIIIAADSDFQDALSAAPIAANLGMPIILVSKDKIPDSVKNFISDRYIPKTYILGDKDIISDDVADEFPNVQRITGKDSYERNINIINAFSDKLDLSSVFLAYSGEFADALSASALAAIDSNPVILVGNQPASITQNFIKAKHITNLNVLGSKSLITDTILYELINM